MVEDIWVISVIRVVSSIASPSQIVKGNYHFTLKTQWLKLKWLKQLF